MGSMDPLSEAVLERRLEGRLEVGWRVVTTTTLSMVALKEE